MLMNPCVVLIDDMQKLEQYYLLFPVNYSMANIDKSKMQEYGRKAAADAARWNASFNKEKREDRR